jgi:hypothetical protein
LPRTILSKAFKRPLTRPLISLLQAFKRTSTRLKWPLERLLKASLKGIQKVVDRPLKKLKAFETLLLNSLLKAIITGLFKAF